MDQRQPRLGDIIDDYCPRERRLSNHVIVAIVGDDVKQTRCTTCDADHPYKGGRVPPRRKKEEAPAALYQQVLDGVQEQASASPAEAESPTPPAGAVLKPAAPRRPAHGGRAASAPPRGEPVAVAASAPEPSPEPDAPPRRDDEGPVHRPLIRATLPRPEGQPQTRQPPDFTLRLPGARLGPFRNGGGDGQHQHHKQKPSRPHGKHSHAHGAPRGAGPDSNGNRSSFGGHGSGHGHQGQQPFGQRRSRPRHGGKKRPR